MTADSGTQTVLITGATDGLGKAAALLLAKQGYRVFAAGRSAEKRAQLDALAKVSTKGGPKTTQAPADGSGRGKP